MPIINPPAQPAPVQQTQQQTQEVDNNNSFVPISNNDNRSNSVSESENMLSQSGTLSNIQVNNSNNGLFTYANGVKMPTNSLVVTGNLVEDGNSVVTISYVHNFQGEAGKLAKQSVSINNAGATASLCANLLKENIMIDYKLAPQFEVCKAFKAVAPMQLAPTASSELAETKLMLQKLIEANKAQQQTIEALQLRLIQMNNSPKVIPARG